MRYEGTRKMGMFAARTRWARVTAAVARYMAGPNPTDDDVHDAEEVIGDYMVWRATAQGDPTLDAMRRGIRHAIENRNQWAR